MDYKQKADLVEGLQQAIMKPVTGRWGLASTEGEYIDDWVAFETYDQETKQKILEERRLRDEYTEKAREEKIRKEANDALLKAIYQRRRGEWYSIDHFFSKISDYSYGQACGFYTAIYNPELEKAINLKSIRFVAFWLSDFEQIRMNYSSTE